MNWTEGEETRNGSLFESREKALKRRSYAPFCANDDAWGSYCLRPKSGEKVAGDCSEIGQVCTPRIMALGSVLQKLV